MPTPHPINQNEGDARLEPQLDLPFGSDTLSPMPTIHIRRKPTRKSVKVLVVTDDIVMRRARATLDRLDAHLLQQQAIRDQAKYREEERKVEPVKLLDDDGKPIREGIHYITENGTCHMPNVFLDNDKHCDNCPLYPWCMAPCKNLKEKGSQPEDKNKRYFRALEVEEQELAEAAEAAAKKLRGNFIRVKKLKVRIRK